MTKEQGEVQIIQEQIPPGYSLYNVPLGRRGGDKEVKVDRPKGGITVSFPANVEILHYSFHGARWVGREVTVTIVGEEDANLKGKTYFVYLKY